MGFFNSISNPLSWISGDIAIDLGTANTLVYIKGRGVLINEPSIVAKSVHDYKIIAVGYDAKAMVGESKGSLSNIIILFFIGLISLLVGTEIFLNSSIEIAKIVGISNYVVGLSITAVGTSLPELAASIESVRKKHIDFVVGNILGSNIFNITLVIGLAGLISPGGIMLQGYLPREMIMIFITTIGLALALYIIIKNYNWLITKVLSLSLVVLFLAYQLSLYGISL